MLRSQQPALVRQDAVGRADRLPHCCAAGCARWQRTSSRAPAHQLPHGQLRHRELAGGPQPGLCRHLDPSSCAALLAQSRHSCCRHAALGAASQRSSKTRFQIPNEKNASQLLTDWHCAKRLFSNAWNPLKSRTARGLGFESTLAPCHGRPGFACRGVCGTLAPPWCQRWRWGTASGEYILRSQTKFSHQRAHWLMASLSSRRRASPDLLLQGSLALLQ